MSTNKNNKRPARPITGALGFLKKIIDRAETYALVHGLDAKTVNAAKKAKTVVVRKSKEAAQAAGTLVADGKNAVVAKYREVRSAKNDAPTTPAKPAGKPAAKPAAKKAPATKPDSKSAAKPAVKKTSAKQPAAEKKPAAKPAAKKAPAKKVPAQKPTK